jgi:sorting nexin-1/2
LGPLGPLGDNATPAAVEQPPVPPQKEQTVTHNLRQPSIATQSPIGRNILDAGDGTDEIESPAGPKIPPPVEPALVSPTRRDTQPSVSIEQAAKPTFDISVGDPHKVGDLTSSHIVYLVKTKVRGRSALQPSSSLNSHRRLQKLIGSPNFPSPEDTEISYGYTTRSIRITPE